MTIRAKPIRQTPDDPFPNDSCRPYLIAPPAEVPAVNDPAVVFADRIKAHAWDSIWPNRVFYFHHLNGTSGWLVDRRPM